MKADSRSFSQFIGHKVMLAFSLIVLLLFLHNLPLFYEVAVVAILALLIYASGSKVSIPKPTKDDIMPLVPSIVILIVLAFYLFKAPYLPDFPSRDLFDHSFSVSDYASGAIPPIQGQLLYYGIRYVLAFFVSLSQLPTIIGIRYGMALIAILSPYIFYDFGVSFFKSHRAAWIASLLYAASGLWFSMVFDAGLLPTFYAILSGLFLVSVTMSFLEKKVGVSSLFLLGLALINAFLSHYTIVFLLIPLALFAPLIARKGLIVTASILAPLALGYFLFKDIVSTLFGFLQGPGAPFADTWLGSLFPASAFKYLITDLGNDWMFAFVVVPCFVAFVYQTYRKPDLMKFFLLVWFGFTVALAPLNFAAWRFSYVALVPLLLIVAFALSIPLQKMKIRSVFEPKVFGLMALMVIPVFMPGWGGIAINTTMLAPQQFNAQQTADYNAILWMKTNIQGSVVTPADLSLTFSQTLGGPPVFSACESGIGAWHDPEQLSFFAIQKGASYLLITSGLDCQPPTVAIRTSSGGAANQTLLPMQIITPATLGCKTDCTVYKDLPYVEIFKITGT